MRLGVCLAHAGRCADPAAIRSSAAAAEQVGYASVWVGDRLPAPGPRRSGAPTAVGALDPLSVLTYAAAVTSRVRLGTSVLVAPWYWPALLARALRSLDVLSDGRLTVGLGLGWTLDDHTTVDVPAGELGRRLDDALDMLGAVWDAPSPDGSDGSDGSDASDGVAPVVGAAAGGPASTVRRRPPVLLTGCAPDALDRVAGRADGWNPIGVPIDELAPMWASVRDLAAAHGRDPEMLELVVRAEVEVTEAPVEGDRRPYCGTVEQVAADIADTRRAGAHEIILGPRGDLCLDQALDLYARLAETVDVATA